MVFFHPFHSSNCFLEETRDPVVIVTGGGAEGLAVTPDGREIWVTNRIEGTISIIDAETLEIVEALKSHPFAARIEISSEGHVAIPNGAAAEQLAQYLQIIDLESREVIADLPLDDGRPASGGFGVLIQGSVVYVAGRGRGDLRVFDLRRLEAPPVVVSTRMDDPDGMAWSPLRVAAFDR
jgi:YVTN family beta-propeller protein